MSEVIIRDLKSSDIDIIDDIHRRQSDIGIPSLSYMIVNAVVERDKEIIGYGAVKIFAEAVLILDKSISKKDKAKAIMETMQAAILYSRDAGIEMLYAISNDESFTKCLENRFTFKRVPGTLVCLDLNPNFEDR